MGAICISCVGLGRKLRPVHGTEGPVQRLLNMANLKCCSGCDRNCYMWPTCCVAVVAIANTALSVGYPRLSAFCCDRFGNGLVSSFSSVMMCCTTAPGLPFDLSLSKKKRQQQTLKRIVLAIRQANRRDSLTTSSNNTF